VDAIAGAHPPSTRVTCDVAIVGQLIGPAGATIKRLQAETSARISVDSQRTPCEVTISGATPAIVAAARRAVEAITSPPSILINCDAASVGQLIGPKGATIKRLQAETGARIDVNSQSIPCTIKISAGSESIVATAQRAVYAVLHPPSLEFECKSRHIPRLIGAQGAVIKALQELTGARINVDRVVLFNGTDAGSEGGVVLITISGTHAAVAEAEPRVRALVFPLTASVPCPRALAGAMIGDEGEHIEALRSYCRRPLLADVTLDRGGKKTKNTAMPLVAPSPLGPFVNIDVGEGGGVA